MIITVSENIRTTDSLEEIASAVRAAEASILSTVEGLKNAK